MAKVKRTTPASKSPASKSKMPEEKFQFPLGKTNFLILLLGVFILVIGFVFMALPDDPDAFLTRTLAPILLVFSFLVVIPVGLLYKEKSTKK